MKLKYILLQLLALTFMVSCEDKEDFDDLASAEYQYVGIPAQRAPSSVPEGGAVGGMAEIPLYYYLSSNEDVDITISFSGAVLGEDFTLPDAKSTSGDSFVVTLPGDTAVTSFMVQTIGNFDAAPEGTENTLIELEITGLPDNLFTGNPVSASWTVEILEDDCEFVADDFAGTATASDFIGADANGDQYEAIITLMSGSTYEVDGVAQSFLGAGNPFQFTIDASDPTAFAVDVPTQTFSAFGRDWEITDVDTNELVDTCGGSVTFTYNLVVTAPTPGEFDFDFTTTYVLP